MFSLGVGSFLLFVLILGGLVFAHELGHFLSAKWLGIHVEEFGFGFPPRVLGVVRDAEGRWRWFRGQNAPKPAELGGPRTIYSLNALPVGGFVRPAGEDNPDIPGGLASAPKRVRLAVLGAGAGFNLIFAFLAFWVGYCIGWPVVSNDAVSIAAVSADSPAQAAGILPGDIIRSLDGQAVSTFKDVSDYVGSHAGQTIAFGLERKGQAVTVTAYARTPPERPTDQGAVGIVLGQPYKVVSYAPPEAAYRAGIEMVDQFRLLASIPGMLWQREIPLEMVRPVGVVGLNDLTRDAVVTAQQVDAPFPIFRLIGLLSIALALTQLLPLPALDGGRILFVLIEAVRGRRVNPARETMVHMAGMLVLLALMAIVTYYDIVNPIVPR